MIPLLVICEASLLAVLFYDLFIFLVPPNLCYGCYLSESTSAQQTRPTLDGWISHTVASGIKPATFYPGKPVQI